MSRSDEVEWLPIIDELLSDALAGASIDARMESLPTELAARVRRMVAAEGSLMRSPRIDDPEALTSGSRVGRYRILELLGSGGQGRVFRARDPSLGRDIALKQLNGDAARSRPAVARLLREARALSRLEHPGLCAIHDVGVEDGVPYLAMALIPGESLQSRLDRGERWSPDAVASIVAQVADAVQMAHEAGVVHRDLKAGNVILRPDGRPVLLDFGLAMTDEASPRLTSPWHPVGTPAIMAPEQIEPERGPRDRRIDVWALGVLLHQLLVGRLPFDGETREALYRRILAEETPKLPRDLPGLSRQRRREFQELLARSLAARPGARFATAAEFARAIETVRSGRTIVGSVAQRAWVRVRQHGVRSIVLVGALASMTGLATFAIRSQRDAEHWRAKSAESDASLRAESARLRAFRALSEGYALLESDPSGAIPSALAARESKDCLPSARSLALCALLRTAGRTSHPDIVTPLVVMADSPIVRAGFDRRGRRLWTLDDRDQFQILDPLTLARSSVGERIGVRAAVEVPVDASLVVLDPSGRLLQLDDRERWLADLGAKEDSEVVETLTAHPSERELVAATWRGQMLVKWSEVDTDSGSRLPIPGCAPCVYSQDGARIFSPTTDGGLLVLDSRTGRELASFDHGGPRVTKVAAAADSRWVVAGDALGRITRYRLSPRESIPLRLTGHGSAVRHLVLDGARSRIVSGGDDGVVRVQTQEASDSSVLYRFASSVTHLESSGHGRYLASADASGLVVVHDLLDDRVVVTHRPHADGLRGVRWHPAGHSILSFSRTGVVAIWPIDPFANLRPNSRSPR